MMNIVIKNATKLVIDGSASNSSIDEILANDCLEVFINHEKDENIKTIKEDTNETRIHQGN